MPSNTAVVRALSEAMRMAEHSPIRARSAEATTALRFTTSTEFSETRTNIASSAARSPCGGAVASSMPPCAGSASTAEHGMLAARSIGTCAISGACTFCSVPPCGQFNTATVCLTGRNGVANASRAPSAPTTRAIIRAVRKSRGRTSGAAGGFVKTAVAASGTNGNASRKPKTRPDLLTPGGGDGKVGV
ncbi:Uncharacterised protein [Mycobacteroides abscessus subsp. abscessus]|nr:Uncharacterised protein [Mycobacteroides abscessus subsp. abscessus]